MPSNKTGSRAYLRVVGGSRGTKFRGRFLDFFKREGKEVERKRKKMKSDVGGWLPVNIFGC